MGPKKGKKGGGKGKGKDGGDLDEAKVKYKEFIDGVRQAETGEFDKIPTE